MSFIATSEPKCTSEAGSNAIETIIEARPRDIGGLSVRRSLPAIARRSVGPFVFFDHMGPAALKQDERIDIPPHPHINLATVTYLFEGEMLHRDSLGSRQVIRPGEINWMTAGRGIVHSERSVSQAPLQTRTLHGVQLWIALPQADEECEPEFFHHPADVLPVLEVGDVRVRVLLGSAFGKTSPVHTFSPTLYVDAAMPAASKLEFDAGTRERAVYVIQGTIECDGQTFAGPCMLALTAGANISIRTELGARVMFLGGEPLDGPRHIWWNFVSSSAERIEQAKRAWKDRTFPTVPGDEIEFVPLPER